jgi:undecaprenyl-diphosphatase
MIAATWIFAMIAKDVAAADRITIIDKEFSAWLHARAQPALTSVLLFVTTIHGHAGVLILMSAAFLLLIWRHHRSQAIALACSVFGGMVLNPILKNVFLRARPQFENPIVTLTLTTYGFPSGHTMMAASLYGALAAFAIWNFKNWAWRVLSVLACGFLILLVGFSRIYLGAHYLSDVLGAFAEGMVWLAFCLTAVSVIRRWPRSGAKTTANDRLTSSGVT